MFPTLSAMAAGEPALFWRAKLRPEPAKPPKVNAFAATVLLKIRFPQDVDRVKVEFCRASWLPSVRLTAPPLWPVKEVLPTKVFARFKDMVAADELLGPFKTRFAPDAPTMTALMCKGLPVVVDWVALNTLFPVIPNVMV